MAATDLTGVFEKLAWADEQIADLNVSISDYLAREPHSLRPQPAPNGRGQVYYFEATELVPPKIAIKIGAIIHAQRSALDNLAATLATRSGHPDARDVYFPITKSETELHEKQAQKKIRKLSQMDQDRIIAWRPYQGGNDLVYALHHLNLQDKHRQLVLLGNSPTPGQDISFSGSGTMALFTFFSGPYPNGHPVYQLESTGNIRPEIPITVHMVDVPSFGSIPPQFLLSSIGESLKAFVREF
jgi:hypothetical protein